MPKHDMGMIKAALREHADAKVVAVGNPRIGVGKWIGCLAAAGVVCAITLASGAVVSGEAKASAGYGASVGGPISAPSMPLSIPPLYSTPTAVDEPQITGPVAPYLSPEFHEVAIDAIRHNSGLSPEAAREVVQHMEDAGQHCVRLTPGRSGCVFSSNGVELDYEKLVYTVTYERHAKDGSVDLGDRKVGAVQKGSSVEVTADPFKRSFDVPQSQP